MRENGLVGINWNETGDPSLAATDGTALSGLQAEALWETRRNHFMGEAKRRGTREERVLRAIARDQSDLRLNDLLGRCAVSQRAGEPPTANAMVLAPTVGVVGLGRRAMAESSLLLAVMASMDSMGRF